MTPCTYLSRKFPTRSKRIDVIARFLFPIGNKSWQSHITFYSADFQCSRLSIFVTGFSICQQRERLESWDYNVMAVTVIFMTVINYHEINRLVYWWRVKVESSPLICLCWWYAGVQWECTTQVGPVLDTHWPQDICGILLPAQFLTDINTGTVPVCHHQESHRQHRMHC